MSVTNGPLWEEILDNGPPDKEFCVSQTWFISSLPQIIPSPVGTGSEQLTSFPKGCTANKQKKV